MSFVIAFVSQKGGVGKSTLSRACAVELVKNNYTVKVADLDTQQGTTLDWHRLRLDNKVTPNIHSVECYNLVNDCLQNSDNFDFLIMDAPARSSKGTLEIAKIADIIIQPSGASLDDLNPAILVFHELIKKGISRDKLFMSLCRIGTHSEYEDAYEYIKNAGFNILDGYLLEKASYRQAHNQGKTILESHFNHLKQKADVVIQSTLDNFKNLIETEQK